MNQLQQQFQQMLQQQQQQQQQPAPAPVPAPAPGHAHAAPGGLKPNKPPAFKGSGRGRERVQEWLFQLNNFFSAHGHILDEQKIAYAGTRLESIAAKWWRRNHATLTAPGATFQDFSAALEKAFLPHNVDDRARDDLLELKQRGSVESYNERWMEVTMSIAVLDEAQALHKYVHGLRPDIQHHVKLQRCTTVDDAMKAASDVEDCMRRGAPPPAPNQDRGGRYQHNRGINRGNGQHRHGGNHRPQQQYQPRLQQQQYHPPGGAGPSSGPVPMELGAADASQRRTRLTPEQRSYLLANNGCVYCRKLGHKVDSCPELRGNNRATPGIQGNGRRRGW